MQTGVAADLAARVEALSLTTPGSSLPPGSDALIDELLTALERGTIRAAERDAEGRWNAVPWVKRGILLGFRAGSLVVMPGTATESFSFVDKHTFPTRRFAVDDGVRVVPGGSTVRRGAFLARGVICMPPMYVNVGAHVGTGTLIDSHALVGSCAQVGERVHLSAAAQIGGVLEPVNAAPVIIEDDVLVGGNCGVYEGTIVRQRAVIAAGVVLTRSTPVYDLVHETVYRGSAAAALEIPAGAVVVPGSRRVRGGWAEEMGIALQTPVIVKYRDEKTDVATALEGWLR
ncbi:MAG: 2,3,4,5-tetrahydropyridine-2,6-dicarboxylate N-succinyltransferase [Gemmatimonadaceae bacterium]